MNSRKTCCVMSSTRPGQGAYLSATPLTKSCSARKAWAAWVSWEFMGGSTIYPHNEEKPDNKVAGLEDSARPAMMGMNDGF